MQDVEKQLNHLILLVNRESSPMLFIMADWKKFINMNVHHIMYKNKRDKECPFLNIRITSFKPDYTHNYVRV
jgi:hypothetical protein